MNRGDRALLQDLEFRSAVDASEEHPTDRTLRVLLIEDSPSDAYLVREYLSDVPAFRHELAHATSLTAARRMLETFKPDVLLLDLGLEDTQGFETFRVIREWSGSLPVVVLSGLDDERVALQAVREGAQDYLVKGHLHGALLTRVMRYAVERARLEQALAEESRRWRSMIRDSADVIALLDDEHRVQYVSDAITRNNGHVPDELVGRDIFTLVHPEDLPELRRRFALIVRRPPQGGESIKVRLQHKDGSWRWWEAVARNRLEQPAPAAIVVNARDVTDRMEAEARRALLESVVVSARDSLLVTHADLGADGQRIVFANPAHLEMTGYTEAEILGKTPRMFQGPETDRAELDRIRSALEAGEPVRSELVNYSKDGQAYRIELDIAPVLNEQGEITHFVSVQRDVTEQRAAEARLERLRRFRSQLDVLLADLLAGPVDASSLQRVLDTALAIVPGAQAGSLILRRGDGDFQFGAQSGYGPELLSLILPKEFVVNDITTHRPVVRNEYVAPPDIAPEIEEVLYGPVGRASEIRASLKVPLWIEGELRGAFQIDSHEHPDAFDEDAIEMGRIFGSQAGTILQRLDLQSILERQETADPLTGLLNRKRGEQILGDELAEARAGEDSAAVSGAFMLLDVDNFKLVNDAYGHSVGDAVLKEVASRLRSAVGETGNVARWAGDEFMVILPAVTTLSAAESAARQIGRIFEARFETNDASFDIEATMGVVLFPRDGRTAQDILQNANVVLRQTKQELRGRYGIYNNEMGTAVRRRADLERALRDAVRNGEIAVHYQPRIELRTGRVIAVEALARWTHPLHGPISPAEFIPIAEDTGLIHDLGDHVLNEACAQAKRWQAQAHPCIISVNLSAQQLRDPDLVQRTQAALEQHDLTTRFLEYEVTESTAMTDVEATIEILSELQDLGIKLAIDDFGTAYSSLAYLKLLPVDALKIDRSFIKDIGDDPSTTPNEAAIAQAIVALGKSLNLDVVAEGIETPAQRKFLQFLGCDEGQGYLLGKPSPADQVDFADRR